MKANKVLILGGTSFLGFSLIEYLSSNKSHDDLILKATYLSIKPKHKIEFERCNLLSYADLYSLGSFDCVIQYSSRIVGDNKKEQNMQMVKNCVEFCNKNNSRYIYISSSQVNFDTDTEYSKSKRMAEKYIQENSKDYIIIRPAAPYGSVPKIKLSRTQPFNVLASTIKKLPAVPVIGNGKYLRQPVHLDNFNELIAQIIKGEVKNKVFDIGGPEQLSFNKIVNIIAKANNKKVLKLHLPVFMFIMASRFVGFIDAENLRALGCDEKADNSKWQEYFNIDLIKFKEGAKSL